MALTGVLWHAAVNSGPSASRMITKAAARALA